MVILIGTLLGIGCGCAFGVIISNLLKTKKKRDWKEEEKIRTLEHELSFLNSKCDNTQKACRLLSEEVKRLNKIIEKEMPPVIREETSQENENNSSIPPMNNGFSCNESSQDIANSIHNSLQSIRANENLTLQNLESMINCYNANMMGNLELMTKCGVSFEEAQEKLSYPYMYLWLRSPNEN